MDGGCFVRDATIREREFRTPLMGRWTNSAPARRRRSMKAAVMMMQPVTICWT